MTRQPASPVHIAFRCDASLEIGVGHVFRCLTLADDLVAAGHKCHFLARSQPGAVDKIISGRGHALHRLAPAKPSLYGAHPTPPAHAQWLGSGWREDATDTARILAGLKPGWLVVDHYALDRRWEESVLPSGAKLMVIDDLADRAHMCDILLDQNLGRLAADYDGLVPEHCQRLIGPQYALLRPEFQQFRHSSAQRRQNAALEHILITMGGVDKDNVTAQVLDVLADCNLPETAHIMVVMGKNAPALKMVRAKALSMPRPTRVSVGIENMAEVMASADLAIGAAGSTSWERCCLGLPTLMLTVADNQKEAAKALEKSGSAVLLGDTRETGWADRLASVLPQLSVSALAELSENALKCTPGSGSALTIAKMGLA